MAGTIHFEKSDGVATLTLDNPKARNAFDYEMTQELRQRWAEISGDPEIVCTILTGAGEKAFCTGWDLSSTAAGESQKFAKVTRHDAPYSQITALQNRCWKPVITAVNGQCVGGGLHFVADSELVIAADTASFFDTHVEFGLVSALEPAGLARRIPLEQVFRLALLGSAERMSAAEAHRIGLVGEVVAADALMARARELAGIMTRFSPTALARTKRAIWESLDQGLEKGLDAAYEQLEAHADHPDMVEGPTSFFEKRPARWAPYEND